MKMDTDRIWIAEIELAGPAALAGVSAAPARPQMRVRACSSATITS